MHKTVKSLLIISAILSVLLVSCNSGDGNNPNTDDTADSVTNSIANETTDTVESEPLEAEVDLTGRAAAKDDLPDDLSFGGETLRIFHRQYFADYLNGDDEGDQLAYAIYKRNQSVSERLDVDIDYFTKDDDSVGEVSKSIIAGDDSIDVVLHTEWKIVGLVIDGGFRNMANEQYLDLSKDWWLPKVTGELNISSDKVILFTGEMLTENIGSMSAMYVNKELYSNKNGSVDDFYSMILDGDWTQDIFYNYVESAYLDLDGSTRISLDDQFGFAGDYWSSVDNLTFTSDISYSIRDENGLPVLNMNTPRMVKLIENLYRLYYENNGVLFTNEENLISNFVNNKTMFMGYRLSTAMDDRVREMESDYGIIPYPKLDEEQQEYVTLIHNASPVIAVPVTCKRLDMVCATLEALSSESYRNVTPAYYEAALKAKYIRDDISSQMIDLIYNGARKDMIYDLNPGGAGQVTRALVEVGNSNFASFYKANENKYNTALNDLIEAYRELD